MMILLLEVILFSSSLILKLKPCKRFLDDNSSMANIAPNKLLPIILIITITTNNKSSRLKRILLFVYTILTTQTFPTPPRYYHNQKPQQNHYFHRHLHCIYICLVTVVYSLSSPITLPPPPKSFPRSFPAYAPSILNLLRSARVLQTNFSFGPLMKFYGTLSWEAKFTQLKFLI